MIIDCFDGEFAFLSNFYEQPHFITDEMGISYITVEHYFQAAKTLDKVERKRISILDTPGKAKRAGRGVSLRPDWEEVKTDVMRRALMKKFSDPLMKAKLLETGDAELIEGNHWHDNVWGSCQCSKCQNTGENRLGKLLMEIRKELR